MLIAGHGIESDAKAGVQGRHLNILSASSQRALKADGYDTRPGAIGEQLVVDGLTVEEFAEGVRLAIGDAAVVETVELRAPCSVFESNQGKPREGAVGRIGVMARVVQGGTIRLGDPVRVVEPVTA